MSQDKPQMSREEMLECLDLLDERECEVLYWVCKGQTYGDIGDRKGLSEYTITEIMGRVYDKLGIDHLDRDPRRKVLFETGSFCDLHLERVTNPEEDCEEKSKVVKDQTATYAVRQTSETKPDDDTSAESQQSGFGQWLLVSLALVAVLCACMMGSVIAAGFIPPIPLADLRETAVALTGIEASSPSPTQTESATRTAEPEETSAVVSPPSTQTPTSTPRAEEQSATATSTATRTSTVTATASPTPAATFTPTRTPTLTPAPAPVDLPFEDTFNQVQPRPEWDPASGTWRVSQDRYTYDQTNSDVVYNYVGDEQWTDYAVEFDIGRCRSYEVIVRSSDEGRMILRSGIYQSLEEGSQWYLEQNNTRTPLADKGRFHTSGEHTIRIEVVGDRYAYYLDGSQDPLLDVQDSTLTQGRVGIGLPGRDVCWIDNFSVMPIE